MIWSLRGSRPLIWDRGQHGRYLSIPTELLRTTLDEQKGAFENVVQTCARREDVAALSRTSRPKAESEQMRQWPRMRRPRKLIQRSNPRKRPAFPTEARVFPMRNQPVGSDQQGKTRSPAAGVQNGCSRNGQRQATATRPWRSTAGCSQATSCARVLRPKDKIRRHRGVWAGTVAARSRHGRQQTCVAIVLLLGSHLWQQSRWWLFSTRRTWRPSCGYPSSIQARLQGRRPYAKSAHSPPKGAAYGNTCRRAG